MLKDKIYTAIATGFGVGKIPFAPGTFGSLLGVFIWVVINYFFAGLLLVAEQKKYDYLLQNSATLIVIFWSVFCLLTFYFGVKAAQLYSDKTKKDDAKEIVIDEICGQIVALFLSSIALRFIYIHSEASQTLATSGVITDQFIEIAYIALAFIFFRLFDITKPFIIGTIDKNLKSGFGVMLDDLMAGFAAALLVFAIAVFCVGNFT